MGDSAPRKTAQADAKQTDAKQADAKQADEKQAEAAAPGMAATAAEAETGEAAAKQAATADGDGKPDMDEVKRKFREALDKKRELQAEGSAGGGRNTGKIHGAHGSEDHRRTFRRKSG